MPKHVIHWTLTSFAVCLSLAAISAARHARMAHTFHPRTGAALLVPGEEPDGGLLLFNGWRLHPAGRRIGTGDMLLGGAISPDGKSLAITNCGYNTHAVHFIDLATEKETAHIDLLHAWSGIAWAPDGDRVYVSGGIDNPTNDIYVLERDQNGGWSRKDGYALRLPDKAKRAVSGLALTQDGGVLFAANDSDDNLYAVDTHSGATLGRTQVGDHPLACKLGPDGRTLYVTLWGAASVVALDIAPALDAARNASTGDGTADIARVKARYTTGAHPNDLAFSPDGRMFVSCGNADAVSVVELASGRTTETVRTALTHDAPEGAEPEALALSPDARTLYVANANNNDVCVIDVSRPGHARVRGFIPTGWYPSAVVACPDGKRVILCSGKGGGTGPNPATLPIDPEHQSGFQHMGRQLRGFLAFVDVPDDATLAGYTRQVIAGTPYHDAQLNTVAQSHTIIPTRVGAGSPIKHILYIIKENRTYDQVFGDMSQGNGDPNYTLFGRAVTPNHHALAEQFVLLDNLYCNGEVSADGHPWSTSADADDFVERSWLLSYSGHGATHETPSVTDPQAGYIWDACRRKGLSYRSYGEYVWWGATSAAAPSAKLEGETSLAGHGSERWDGLGWPKDKEMRDMDKAQVFIDEFKEFERTGSMPNFMVMSLGEDHTDGTRPGSFTPKAKVGSNDQALGRIVETISHSSLWKQFAIFVIEDDAQNGPDHVDAHRTVGLVISPYTRRHYVDSTMYSTASMLRTMELLLGLPPLSQYDAAARPMFASFTDRADLTPYTVLAPQTDLTARNSPSAYGAQRSARMDFRGYDRAPEAELNEILWHSIKGTDLPMPPPARLVTASAPAHAEEDR